MGQLRGSEGQAIGGAYGYEWRKKGIEMGG